MSEIAAKTKSLDQSAHFNMYNRLPLTLIQGKGATVVDSEGREYIDALAGIAVNSLGHCHPNVVNAIKEQAEKLIHISNIYYSVPQSTLAALLTKVAGLDKVFFCNSGAEANEGALKLVRKHASEMGRKGKILTFDNCFHGRTLATITMGTEKYQKGFGPVPEGFIKAPFNDIEAVKKIAEQETLIAIFVEPIQGEGGINEASHEFLKALRHLCDEHDILLVYDEIQCGMGRSGKMFAYQHSETLPDVLTLAKGLGSGFPIGAVLATEKVASAFKFGDHGTTFGGNPLACAAAFATLKTIIADKLVDEAAEKGIYFLDKLKAIQEKTSLIKEVRGKGLMIGAELNFKGREVMLKMMEHGVLANCTAQYVIRFVPPLVITYPQIDQVIKIFEKSLIEVSETIE